MTINSHFRQFSPPTAIVDQLQRPGFSTFNIPLFLLRPSTTHGLSSLLLSLAFTGWVACKQMRHHWYEGMKLTLNLECKRKFKILAIVYHKYDPIVPYNTSHSLLSSTRFADTSRWNESLSVIDRLVSSILIGSCTGRYNKWTTRGRGNDYPTKNKYLFCTNNL